MNLQEAHEHCSHHREEIEASDVCACFYCLKEFHPDQITRWVDKDQTAVCPFCGIDSVLGNFAVELEPEFMKQMQEYWMT